MKDLLETSMRIISVHNYYRRAGGEDAVFSAEVALLRRMGKEVLEFAKSNRQVNGMSRLKIAGRAVWSRSSKQELAHLVQGMHPDVAHFHNTFLLISPSAYYACTDAGVPVVQTLHNYRLLCPAATFYRSGRVCEDCLGRTLAWPGVLHRCWRQSASGTAMIAAMLTAHQMLKTGQEHVDIYITPTEFARRKFIEGGIPEEKIVVKPNFVYPDYGKRDGVGQYALFIGRLSREKGVRTLLSAWKRLRIPLKIVGDGPLMDEVLEFLKTHRLEHIEVIGLLEHEEVFRLIKKARVLVVASELYETFGSVVVEAYACGVPVIASRIGALEEIVEDGRTGLHFTPGDPEDLVAKVDRAWSDLKRIAEMGSEARREYETKYNAERNYKMVMDIYRLAIERSEARRG